SPLTRWSRRKSGAGLPAGKTKRDAAYGPHFCFQ
ncbi:hypothetical protein AZ019_003745, partial [Klebsiella pneumoniae]